MLLAPSSVSTGVQCEKKHRSTSSRKRNAGLPRVRNRLPVGTKSLPDLTDILTVFDKCLGAKRERAQSESVKKIQETRKSCPTNQLQEYLALCGPEISGRDLVLERRAIGDVSAAERANMSGPTHLRERTSERLTSRRARWTARSEIRWHQASSAYHRNRQPRPAGMSNRDVSHLLVGRADYQTNRLKLTAPKPAMTTPFCPCFSRTRSSSLSSTSVYM